jgi:hypothetical protein
VDWVEIPAAGAHAKAPAPVLEVLPLDPGMAHHH